MAFKIQLDFQNLPKVDYNLHVADREAAAQMNCLSFQQPVAWSWPVTRPAKAEL